MSPAVLVLAAATWCADPAAVREWQDMAAKHAGSDDWQRLHALWLGLCRKVEEGSIGEREATRLFEQERREMRRRLLREQGEPVG